MHVQLHFISEWNKSENKSEASKLKVHGRKMEKMRVVSRSLARRFKHDVERECEWVTQAKAKEKANVQLSHSQSVSSVSSVSSVRAALAFRVGRSRLLNVRIDSHSRKQSSRKLNRNRNTQLYALRFSSNCHSSRLHTRNFSKSLLPSHCFSYFYCFMRFTFL